VSSLVALPVWVVGPKRRGTRPFTELQIQRVAEAVRKAAPKKVIVLYAKRVDSAWAPE